MCTVNCKLLRKQQLKDTSFYVDRLNTANKLLFDTTHRFDVTKLHTQSQRLLVVEALYNYEACDDLIEKTLNSLCKRLKQQPRDTTLRDLIRSVIHLSNSNTRIGDIINELIQKIQDVLQQNIDCTKDMVDKTVESWNQTIVAQ